MSLVFSCSPGNDLYAAVCRSAGGAPRFDTAAEAVENAAPGSGVLILADEYPDRRTSVAPSLLARAREKRLRLYVEFPDSLEGVGVGGERRAVWERVVVTGSGFAPDLRRLRILTAHQCTYVELKGLKPILSIARVAGYDTALFGLPEDAATLLGESGDGSLMVAATMLSGFVSARFAPHDEWVTAWRVILSKLDPEHPLPDFEAPRRVGPAYGRLDRLPDDAENQAVRSFVQWYHDSRLLVPAWRKAEVESQLAAGAEAIDIPPADKPAGDGAFGILEGYASAILPDGSQPQRLPLRADCNAEAAMVFALDSVVNKDRASAKAARNLLDYLFISSGMCGGVRADPSHPSFGLIGWGAVHPAWTIGNYGDDNARVLLATILASAGLGSGDWDKWVLRGLLANLRTTGRLGFREDRVDVGPLEARGWKAFADAQNVNYSPHFDSYLWACNLWAYKQTGQRAFLESTRNAIRMTMEQYPAGWRWQDSIERARMLLCLAWLLRVDDTPEHREWLSRIAGDLIERQDRSGALQEKLAGTGGGHYLIPQSNETYGTGETPLIQRDGDPASDQLYTAGFALLGFHEAFAATGDASLKAAEDRLAGFLCRVQVRSDALPWLDGCWFRAFDFRRWDYWASSADAGWGAWSVETGWGAAWTAAVLALRAKDTSFWDFTAGSAIERLLSEVTSEMAVNTGGPWQP